jgi:hypothetical protein
MYVCLAQEVSGTKKKSDDGGCGGWYVEHLKSSEHGLFSASVAE